MHAVTGVVAHAVLVVVLAVVVILIVGLSHSCLQDVVGDVVRNGDVFSEVPLVLRRQTFMI